MIGDSALVGYKSHGAANTITASRSSGICKRVIHVVTYIVPSITMLQLKHEINARKLEMLRAGNTLDKMTPLQ